MAGVIVFVVFAAVLILQFWRGWRRGMLATLLGLVGLVAALAVSHLLALRMGLWLGQTTSWGAFWGVLVAGLGSFLLVSGLFEVFARMARRRVQHRGTSRASRVGSAILSVLAGWVFLVLLAWCYELFYAQGMAAAGTAEDDRGTGNGTASALHDSQGRRGLPDLSGTWPMRAARGTFEVGLYAALPRGIQIYFVDAGQRLQRSDPVQRMMSSTDLLDDIMSADEDQIAANTDLDELLQDEESFGLLKQLGMVDSDATPEDVRREVNDELAEVGARMGPVLRDPQVLEALESLASDPDAELDDPVALMADPRMGLILGKIFQASFTAPPEPPPDAEAQDLE